MLIRYSLILICYLLFISLPDLEFRTKLVVILVANTVVWASIAAFWAWVYIQSKARKLIISKVVKIMLAVALGAVLRGIMVFLGIDHPFIAGGLGLIIAGFISIETYDLWLQAGRQADALPEIAKDKNLNDRS